MNRSEKIEKFIETLTVEKKNELLAECIDLLIDGETIGFRTGNDVPHWDGNGENIDGTESASEDDDEF